MKKLELIDFLKGFSITTIVIMHLLMPYVGSTLNKALAFGGAGVHVFILCSGFGLYLSYLNKPLGYGAFLKKRFTKVYVPYLIVVLLCAALPYIYDRPDKFGAVLSHVFLYKMFVNKWDTSLGYPFWFISTIIQFYLCFPLIVKLAQKRFGLHAAIVTSLIWSTLVAVLGVEEQRVWGSFFLQYLWEFVLGMKLASLYYRDSAVLDLPKWFKIACVFLICFGLTTFCGLKGGVFKLYNDIPSLFAYLTMALLVYKTGLLNRFFLFINRFSYEWYLVHGLTFVCVSRIVSTPPNRIDNFTINDFVLGGHVVSPGYQMF